MGKNLQGKNKQKVEKVLSFHDYIGGIRPSNDDPAICSFAKCKATWIGFFTSDLQETENMVRAAVKVHRTNILAFSTNFHSYYLVITSMLQITSTSNSSDSSKRTRTSIHDARIAFHMTTLSQI
jgi:hypothetical protein